MSKTTGEPISFDAFLKTGTVGAATVEIQMNPAVIGKIEAALDRLARAQRAAGRDTGDETLGATARESTADIEAELDALEADLNAGKSTWTLLAISADAVESIVAEFPKPPTPKMPRKPEPLPEQHTADEAKAHARKVRAWKAACKKADIALAEWRKADADTEFKRNCAFIAAAVHEISTPNGVVGKPTPESIAQMYHQPHGKARFERLLAAVNDALRDDVEISRPTLPAS